MLLGCLDVCVSYHKTNIQRIGVLRLCSRCSVFLQPLEEYPPDDVCHDDGGHDDETNTEGSEPLECFL